MPPKAPDGHLPTPVPLRFPVEEEEPRGVAHFVARTFLFQLLRFVLGDEHTVGSGQFVYWDARDDGLRLAPDVFVKLGRRQTSFGAWKTWEQGGAPDLAVEIMSPNEGDGVTWETKLARYHAVGISELVRLDPEAPEGRRLRAWNRAAGGLVERAVSGDTTACQPLRLTWVVRPIPDAPVALRLLDVDGELLLGARESALRRALAAEARVRELEEELRRRR